jgi:phosphoribosylaminoimidazole (AIR) synthetase
VLNISESFIFINFVMLGNDISIVDLLVQGIKPPIFLNYFANLNLNPNFSAATNRGF